MLNCPACQTILKRNISPIGLFWVCPTCEGRALSIEVVRKAVPREIVNKLWQRARSKQYVAQRKCAACKRMMYEVPVIHNEETKYIDVCTGCHFLWFDPGEYEDLKTTPVSEADGEKPSLEAGKAVALAQIESEKAVRESETVEVGGPDDMPELMPALLALPIVRKRPNLIHEPIMTWALSVLIAAISIVAFFNLKPIAANWGLIPAEFGRHFGLTFFSSFFLHGSVLHLVGNLYFLLVFGGNTEDVLGKGRYLVLIAASALIGGAVHVVFNLDSAIPCIGASAGITGVLAYFCMRFPKAGVGVIFGFRWIRMPAGLMFVLWVIFQFIFAHSQMSGISTVSAMAHLGGAAAGVAFWLMTSKSLSGGPRKDSLSIPGLEGEYVSGRL